MAASDAGVAAGAVGGRPRAESRPPTGPSVATNPRAGGASQDGGNGHSRSQRTRLATLLLLAAMVSSLVLAVPGLAGVRHDLTNAKMGWIAAGVALEIASCASFVVIFRLFFGEVAARGACKLAWTEMGSGALLPGGGVGSLAAGGWLLRLAGMPTREIVRRSSSLFFLTSAVNLAALVLGGLLLASGISSGRSTPALVALPFVLCSAGLAGALLIERFGTRQAHGDARLRDELVGGIGEARRSLLHPRWRLVGALGYLGFDIAVLWATLTATGYVPPIAVLLLGYLGGLIPVPGGVGVLEGGLTATLALYGAPIAHAAAGVLLYRAIAFWIPGLGGLLAYRRLRREIAARQARAASGPGETARVSATLHLPRRSSI